MPIYFCITFCDTIFFMSILFLDLVKVNDDCRKCSLFGTDENFCDAQTGQCLCKDNFYGETCDHSKFLQFNLLNTC